MLVCPWHTSHFCKQGPFSAHLERGHQPLGYLHPQALCLPSPEVTSGALAASTNSSPPSICVISQCPEWDQPLTVQTNTIFCSGVSPSPCNWSIHFILQLLSTKSSEHSFWKISNDSKVARRFFGVSGISHLSEKKTSFGVGFCLPLIYFFISFHWSISLKVFFCFEIIHASLLAFRSVVC